MKTKRIVNILLAGFLLIASGPACIISSSPGSSPLAPSQQPGLPITTLPEGDTTKPPGLGSITYTLDSTRQVSAEYDILSDSGVVLSVGDANGYGWVLNIPSGALFANTKIIMTPFATIDVSRSGANIISGVRLEPDGLQFTDAVRLSVTAPIDNPGIGLIFSFAQDGSNVAFAPTTNTASGKTAIAEIWHFSSAGYSNGDTAGQDGLDAYRRQAESEYRWALAAAKLFIQNGAPTPPEPPSISQFCRGTEVNPEEPIQAELFEFGRYFTDPYNEIQGVLLAAIKNLQLLSPDVDTSAGLDTAGQIAQMAQKSIWELGVQVQTENPPDRLFAVIVVALQVEKWVALLGVPSEFLPVITGWGETIRDYYLARLETDHDYRSFPILFTLNRYVSLLGGMDRLEDIMSAMTFEVTIDDSFDGTWLSSGKTYATGSVVQNAKVSEIKNNLNPPDFLWGSMDNLSLKATSGTYTNPTGTYPVAGQTYIGQLWLKNWDACVTKSFDVVLSGFSGVEDVKNRNAAGAASRAGLKQYWWDAGFFMFTVPMRNLNPILGDQNFSGSGSAADGAFTGSGKIHIVIKHTP
jgi:hypothetical protein